MKKTLLALALIGLTYGGFAQTTTPAKTKSKPAVTAAAKPAKTDTTAAKHAKSVKKHHKKS